MKIDVATLFPEAFEGLKVGIIAKALQKQLFTLGLHNIRDYSQDKHRRCDDYPFGGGAGMLMTPQPLHDCINAIDPEHKSKRIFLSPKGATLTQSKVIELAGASALLFVCGAYEGIDQRVVDADIDEQLSIGDYVLTGGELAAMVVINAVARYIPGALGSEQSTDEESFSDGLLEYPQYTRPAVFNGMAVPEVLLSGDHAKVREWRKQRQIEITRELRPDLLKEEDR